MDLLHILGLHTFVPGDLLVVAVLIVLEGLLSCDNAVVLALLVKPLPPELRGRALKYGIIGAYVFRIVAIFLATWIMSKWYLKFFGGVYLLYLGISHFMKKKPSDAEPEVVQIRRWFGLSPFWSTVIAVEMTDIVFSVDSIAAAVALSSKLWILIVGGLLGILAMRFAAQAFVTLLEKFPRLEGAAFVAVAFIGFKLVLELPGDVVGLQQQFRPGTAYTDNAAYIQQLNAQAAPWLSVPHTLTINRAAGPMPEESVIRAGQQAAGVVGVALDEAVAREYRAAQSYWNLHARPLAEIEGWLGSLIVVLIFAGGFMPGKKSKPE